MMPNSTFSNAQLGLVSGFTKAMNLDGQLQNALYANNNKDDVRDPYKSLEYIRSCLKCTVPVEEMLPALDRMFDMLEEDGITAGK